MGQSPQDGNFGLILSVFCRWKQYSCLHNFLKNLKIWKIYSNFQIVQKNLKFIFNTEQVIIYTTYFSKLYLDPNYGDRSTVFTDKIQTELGQNSRPGEIDPYVFIHIMFCHNFYFLLSWKEICWQIIN